MAGRVVAIIEARWGSSRLPGKVLLNVDGDVLLGHLLDRLGTVSSLDDIVVATTENARDDVVAEFVRRCDTNVFRGSEQDVMARVLQAAEYCKADTIVEITADCPLLDPQIVSQLIGTYHANSCDYASNAHIRSYPDGMDVQVFSTDVLRDSLGRTEAPLHREHVSLHIRQHPELYRHVHVAAPQELVWPELGLTLDEPRDFQLISQVIREFQHLRLHYGCEDIVRFLRSRPDLVALNAPVERRGDS